MNNQKKYKLFYLGLVAFGTFAISTNNANAIELEQVSARAGTLGLGAEIGFEIIPTVVVRGIGRHSRVVPADKLLDEAMSAATRIAGFSLPNARILQPMTPDS